MNKRSLELYVDNLTESRDFYESLGLHELEAYSDAEQSTDIVIMENDEDTVKLKLAELGNLEVAVLHQPQTGKKVDLRVANLLKLIPILEEKGTEILQPLKVEANGMITAVVIDPDEYRLRLISTKGK